MAERFPGVALEIEQTMSSNEEDFRGKLLKLGLISSGLRMVSDFCCLSLKLLTKRSILYSSSFKVGTHDATSQSQGLVAGTSRIV